MILTEDEIENLPIITDEEIKNDYYDVSLFEEDLKNLLEEFDMEIRNIDKQYE